MTAKRSAADRAPPVFGQHTRDVFARYGMDGPEIDRLLADGVAYQAEAA